MVEMHHNETRGRLRYAFASNDAVEDINVLGHGYNTPAYSRCFAPQAWSNVNGWAYSRPSNTHCGSSGTKGFCRGSGTFQRIDSMSVTSTYWGMDSGAAQVQVPLIRMNHFGFDNGMTSQYHNEKKWDQSVYIYDDRVNMDTSLAASGIANQGLKGNQVFGFWGQPAVAPTTSIGFNYMCDP